MTNNFSFLFFAANTAITLSTKFVSRSASATLLVLFSRGDTISIKQADFQTCLHVIKVISRVCELPVSVVWAWHGVVRASLVPSPSVRTEGLGTR